LLHPIAKYFSVGITCWLGRCGDARQNPAMTQADRKQRDQKSSVIVKRPVRVKLRAMGCERFDLDVKRDAGETILREATVSDVKPPRRWVIGHFESASANAVTVSSISRP